MSEIDVDVAILGSGFAGSFTAMIVQRLGLKPLLIDKCAHPRFAIGESSTPIANMVLRDLALRYDLPRLLPLTKYGTWQKKLPQLGCGRKRGFSYFKHNPGQPFRPSAEHANELLVTASSSDELSDTHWLRADVDSFFVDEVKRAGIPFFDQTNITHLDNDNGNWILDGKRDGVNVRVAADFLIDATGEAGLLARTLNLSDQSDQMKTNSRALYAHFSNVTPWRDLLADSGGRLGDHPFCCDDAALHHILDGAWMWLLRFDSGVTSAGLVIDNRRHPLDSSLSPEQEWLQWMGQYPSLAEQFSQSEMIEPLEPFRRTGRMQRRFEKIVGRNWAMLPHTAGFVDPLHSTGIAHSLCGVERLAGILERHWKKSSLQQSLLDYDQVVASELTLIDQLVDGCYQTLDRFPLMVAYSMFYFAAATTYEHRRNTSPNFDGQFLCADDRAFRNVVDEISQQLKSLPKRDQLNSQQIADFESLVARAIAPFNRVGLCNANAKNMYHHTAAPEILLRNNISTA